MTIGLWALGNILGEVAEGCFQVVITLLIHTDGRTAILLHPTLHELVAFPDIAGAKMPSTRKLLVDKKQLPKM